MLNNIRYIILVLLVFTSSFLTAQNGQKVAVHEYYDFFNSVSNPSNEVHFMLEDESYRFDLSNQSDDGKLFDTIFQKSDGTFLKQQVTDARNFYWGPGMITASKVVSKNDIIDLFRDGTDEGWDRFYKTFGYQEYWVYSVPLFSADRTICTVKYINYCGQMCKAIYGYYYKKEDGKWKAIYHYRTMTN